MRYLCIDNKPYEWKEILRLRRQQIEAERHAQQPTLFSFRASRRFAPAFATDRGRTVPAAHALQSGLNVHAPAPHHAGQTFWASRKSRRPLAARKVPGRLMGRRQRLAAIVSYCVTRLIRLSFSSAFLIGTARAKVRGIKIGRIVFRFLAVLVSCLVIVIAWERLIRVPFYSIYYRLFDYSTPVDYGGGYVDTLGGTYFDDITKRQSADVQNVLKPLIADLRSKSYDELIILKSYSSPCELSDLIDCKGIDEKIIKQYIEAAFAYRQFIETREDQRFYNKIAVVGLMIGMLSFLVALTLGVL